MPSLTSEVFVDVLTGVQIYPLNFGALVTTNQHGPITEHLMLLSRLMAGDSAATQAFVEHYYEWLHVIVRAQFPQMECVEDVVHDSLLLVIKKIKNQKINDLNKIRAYLRTTTINIAHQYHRRGKRFGSDVELATLKANLQSAAERLDWQKKLELTKGLVKELSMSRDRDIIRAYFFEHLSKKQICDQMGFSPQQFDSIIHRAKARLKKCLHQFQKKQQLESESKTMLGLMVLGLVLNQMAQVMI